MCTKKRLLIFSGLIAVFLCCFFSYRIGQMQVRDFYSAKLSQKEKEVDDLCKEATGLYQEITDLELKFMIEEAFDQRQKKMDDFYLGEFEKSFRFYINSEQKWLQNTQLNNTVANIEKKMIEDGYSNVDAGLIKNKAIEKVKSGR